MTKGWKVRRFHSNHNETNDEPFAELVAAGLGVHHAGLSLEDRRTIEDLFLDGSIRVVCATSVSDGLNAGSAV